MCMSMWLGCGADACDVGRSTVCDCVRVGWAGALRRSISCPLYTTQDHQLKVAVLATGYTLTASPTFTFR